VGAPDSLRAAVEEDRAGTRAWLHADGRSPLAAIARTDLPRDGWVTVGRMAGNDVVLDDPTVAARHVRVRIEGEGFRIEALDPGARFRVQAGGAGGGGAGGGRDTTVATLPPGWIGVGRYEVRLSYQNAPAIIVFDSDAPARSDFAGPWWFPYDPACRLTLPLEPPARPETLFIASSHGPPRAADVRGHFRFRMGGRAQNLVALRLIEPGSPPDGVSLFFRDATSGKESYGAGRYLEPEKAPDGRWVVDFNRAYNPYCAYSPYYNCPVPPAENHLTVAIRAGEFWPADAHGPAAGPVAAPDPVPPSPKEKP
jgi:hypothetical protein